MVVIAWPAAAARGNWQERIGVPSRCTVQAPQKPPPQPNLVPVRYRRSRRTQSKGVDASVSSN